MRWTPVLGIIMAFSVKPLHGLIMGSEFLNKQSMLTVWRNCIGDSLARVLEMERKDAVNDCRNDDLIDIDDIRTRGGGVGVDEDDRRGSIFSFNDLTQTNVRTNDEGGFAGQTEEGFSQSFDNGNEDDREIYSNFPSNGNEFYNERNNNNIGNRYFNNGNSDHRNNEEGSAINKNIPSEVSRKANKTPSRNKEKTHFNLRNAVTINVKGVRKETNNRTFATRGKGKNHFPLFDVLSPKTRKLALEEIPSSRSRTSKEKKPIYFTLIDQSPFLPQSEESLEFTDRAKRQTPRRRPLRFSVQELIEGEKELRAQLSNFSCVLKQLNLMDQSGNLMIDKIINDIEGYQIDPHLKRDLLESAQDCWTITNSLPNNDDDTIIPHSLERAHHFFSCSEKRRLLSCLKKDIREDLRHAVPSSTDSFDMERTVNRIMYIKMTNSFSDIMSSLS